MNDPIRDDLDDDLGLDFTEGEGDPPPLEDEDQANRVLRRVAALERQLDGHKAVARAEVERIAAWLKDRAATIEGSLVWHRRTLEGWMRTTGRSTVKLPNGELRLRPERPKVVGLLAEHGDEDAQLDTLEGLDLGVLRTKRELAVSDILKMAKPGPAVVVGAPVEGYTMHAAVIPAVPAIAAEDDAIGIATDEIPERTIPLVYFLVADRKAFGYTAAKPGLALVDEPAEPADPA